MTKRKKKMKFKKVFVLLIGVLLIASLIIFVPKYFKNEPQNASKETNLPSKKEEKKVQIVDVNSKSRPYAVMINNLAAARPYHTGLKNAYLVYEIIVEGGITRYLALFKDNLPEVVGSVRSARHYYIDYALENDAYYIHWGWSPQAQSDISTLSIDNVNGLSTGTPYFFRQSISGVNKEHTGFANLKEMANIVAKKDYRATTNKALLLNYSATPVDYSSLEDVQESNTIDLLYSKSYVTNYVYDATTQVYKQSVNSVAHTDYATKEQYTVKNIIAYQVKNYSIDEYGRQDIENIGSGKGYYFTNGLVIPITWEKKDRSSQTIYKYQANGKEIKVNDGNTWIHIVPTSGSITFKSAEEE